jgi:hypothetical protein
MEFVLAVIVVALIGASLWSLWFVLTNPRRRAHQIAAELSAPVIATSDAFVVGYRRGASGGAALLFALILVSFVTRTHDVAVIVVALAILGPLAAGCGWSAISGKPVLAITGEGINTCRPRRQLRWKDIETIAIEEGSGYAGVETYDLVLHLVPESIERRERRLGGLVTISNETITTPLALLSPSWHEIVRAIHERSGRQPIVPSRYAAREQHEAHIELR